jgi:hypothetical protein
MYAKFCDIEVLSSYIREVSVGDLLTVQALVTNPLDWQHFYEKLASIKRGDRTDFMVVTAEGDRLAGQGDVMEIEKWSDHHGKYGFKIKINVKKQKSLTDRRTRSPPALTATVTPRKAPVVATRLPAPATAQPPTPQITAAAATTAAGDASTAEAAASFKEMLKGSLAMDIPA